MTLRDFVERLRRDGRLTVAQPGADPYLEIAAALAALDGRPLFFPKPKGFDMPVAGNLVSSRELLAAGLGLSAQELIPALVHARRNPQDPPLVAHAACQDVVIQPADLTRLPVLRHLAQDGGPYITSAVVVVRDPKQSRNLSFHRIMVRGPDWGTIRVVKNRGLDQAIRNAGGDVQIAALLGAPTQVLLAAAMSPPDGVDEMRIAHALADTPLVRCRTVALEVPADTEIVLEGRVTSERGAEGPFIDLTETLDGVRQEPVVRLHCVTHRRDALYHALLPGKGDHKALMGLPREADIFVAVNEACACLDVCVTPGGCSWLHAVVKIAKRDPGDPQRAMEAAFKAHPSLKRVIIVDEDIDAHDEAAVEWAVATRFQAGRGLMVLRGQPSSSLDPSAEHPPGQKARGDKLGVDATAPRRGGKFERLAYPALSPERMRQLLGS
ncbi:MAG TPA: UbiD family decarboxylase [Candidatus Brocadiia bacterium]|nr:UbiD family decarboxylase [Candidatus Brocadiia bacterium]